MSENLKDLEERLETAYRNRPVVYGFHLPGGALITVQQVMTIINNVSGYDRVHEKAIGRCQIPGCGYPLHEENTHYTSEHGNVCQLCHDLMYEIRKRAWFLEMHRLWLQGGEKGGGTATEDRS